MVKVISFIVVLIATILICWKTGLLKQIASPFKAWLNWIGA